MIPLLVFLLGGALVYLGAIEAAFGSLMRLSRRLAAERGAEDGELRRYLDDPDRLFVPVRLLGSVDVILVVTLLAQGIDAATPHRLLIVLAAAAVIVAVCAHLIPAVVIRRDPERTLEALLPSFSACARVVQPLTMAILRIGASRREGAAAPAPAPEEQPGEPAGPGDAGERREGLATDDERRLIRSIVEFGDTLVREVMTPRPDIVAISGEATLGDLRRLLKDQAYSRIPVYRESLDNVLGFVFVKDLVQLTDAEARAITTLMRPAHFVPETKKVPDLLREFQRQQVQIAIVVDEYGGTAGLVSLEDLIEEIVGEIRDEYDEEADPVTDEGGGVFVFGGQVDVDQIGERLGVQIAREGFETVGGYLLSRLGRVPAVGERLEVDDLTVEVVEAERRRVKKVRIRRRAVAAAAEDA